MNKENFMIFLKKYKEAFAFILLMFLCYFLYFFPQVLSVKAFGITDIRTQLPVALTAAFGVFIVYLAGRKISSKKYGIISAIILATCIEYIMHAKFSSIVTILSVCIAASFYTGIYTLFGSEKYRKYFWWLSYIFAGLGILTADLFAFVVPAVSILLAYIAARRWKEIFKPVYFIPGIILFILVSLPWHILAYQHGMQIFSRFEPIKHGNIIQIMTGSLYLFVVGFMPWIFSFLSQIIVYFKKHLKETGEYFSKFNNLQPLERFMIVNVIFLAVIFVFQLMPGMSITLPAIFPASMILGKFWFDYVCKDENCRAVNISTLVLNFGFIICAVLLMFSLQQMINTGYTKELSLPVTGLVIIMAAVTLNIFAIVKDKRLLHFFALAGFVAALTVFVV